MKIDHKILCISITLCTIVASIYGQTIHQATRAGQFYPANPIELKETIDEYLMKAKSIQIPGNIQGIWVPHAGYMFSGQIAANAYKTLIGESYDTIILIGPSHYTGIYGASVGLYDFFETPLGKVPVNKELANQLIKKSSYIKDQLEAHEYEHSLEVQLPFVQTVLPNTPIVPIVIGRVPLNTCKSIAKTIHKLTKDKKILMIASSDMSHYPNYQDAYEVDLRTIDAIMTFDVEKVANLEKFMMRKGFSNLECTLCGAEAVYTTMYVCKDRDCKDVRVLPYANSGDISGERYRVVGYGSAVFYKEDKNKLRAQKRGGQDLEDIQLSENEQKQLFKIARESILKALKKEPQTQYNIADENLLKKRGVFVTLTNHGNLRGCIGHFGQDTPLYRLVQEMAVAAAVQDYRFAYNPITVDEMDKIEIKISILSSLKPIHSVDEIEIGKDGIWIKKGNRSGTYLPEVATEQGWNAEQFAEHCAVEKAGLDRASWKNDADMYIYSSIILKESRE